MISIAVCEDELDCCLHVKKLIESVFSDGKAECQINCFFSGEELLNEEIPFDVVFMDISLQDINGIEVAKRLRDRGDTSILIFITAYEEYMQQSFDVEAFHYIVKPVDEEKFSHILERVMKKLESKEDSPSLVICEDHQKIRIPCRELIYIEVLGRQCRFHTQKSIYTAYERLGELESRLQNGAWVRVHKSFLVNLQFVKSYDKNGVTMDNGDVVPLSKRRYAGFRTDFLAFLKQEGGML